ncbi:MAG: B-box zinc finger protein [Chloroflexi bacterium]|nr:B-box zinc finger protein [Chloroflexota bacterium]
MSASESLVCRRHPAERTYIRCGKCEEPVCPRCMVHTPVGVRCPNCVTYVKDPIYDVRTTVILKAALVGAGLALLGGVAWGLIQLLLPFLFVRLLLAGVLGYAMGTVVGASANRKRGAALQAIAGGSVLGAFLLAAFVAPFAAFSVYNLLALIIGVVTAVSAVR